MARKQLNSAAITNELEGSAFFRAPRPAQLPEPPAAAHPVSSPPAAPTSATQPRPRSTTQSVDPTVQQSADQSSGQSTPQSTHQSMQESNESIGPGASAGKMLDDGDAAGDKLVDRPKAFYITERLDARLDEAVRYLQEVHGIKKADRSTLVNAALDQEEQWAPQALDQLAGRVLSQLTSRLTRK